MKIIFLLFFLFPIQLFAQASMRRCTLLPVTDSVGGAIGFKVFEEVEAELKQSNWCTYVSNSGMIGIFSRYRENLALHLKEKEVVKTVASKLQVGSILRINLVSELNGIEVQMEVVGDNGEDLYFSEKSILKSDDIENIAQTVKNWLDMYAKMIPYDAKVNGVLGEQVTLDVGKGYPIHVGQDFVIKRLVSKKKHPLLKKVVDWDAEVLAQGKIFNISDNQALGMVKVYKTDKKIENGDWVRLEPFKQDAFNDKSIEDKKEEEPGKLGVLSLALVAANSSLDTSAPGGSSRMSGGMFGFDFRVEGWVTRQYIAALQVARTIGKLSKSSGNPEKDSVNAQFGQFKLTGGYRYLPIGFFYGPQIDLYAGYANYAFDVDVSETDGFGKGNLSGILLGVAANVPINREFRFNVKADFLPFPSFKDGDNLYGTSKSASVLDLEVGTKYQYTSRMTLDASVGTFAAKSKFSGDIKEVSYHENLKLKLGASFNF